MDGSKVPPKITPEKAKKALDKAAKKVKESDLEKLANRKQEVDEKLKSVPGTLQKMINEVTLLFEMIRDYWTGEYKDLPWFTIATAVGALLYFLSPIDLIPDVIPVVGYVDDALVITLAIKGIQEDLRRYCAFKKYDSALYFE